MSNLRISFYVTFLSEIFYNNLKNFWKIDKKVLHAFFNRKTYIVMLKTSSILTFVLQRMYIYPNLELKEKCLEKNSVTT